MVQNVNLASAGIQFLTLARSLKELNKMHEMFVQESMKLSDKMLEMNVTQAVQNQQTAERINVLA